MTTITLHLPDTTTAGQLIPLVDSIGCSLRKQEDGSYIAVPRDAQTNSNVVKMPRRKRQFMHAAVPTEPEPA